MYTPVAAQSWFGVVLLSSLINSDCVSGLVMRQRELKCVCFGRGVLTILFLFLLQSNSKLKLVRSLAVCEESSSPFVDGLLESQVGLE